MAVALAESGGYRKTDGYYLLPVRIRFTTTPCHGRPVRVGIPSSFMRAAMRIEPETFSPQRPQPFYGFRFALIIPEWLPSFAAALFRPFPHPRAAELQHDLRFLVLRHGARL